jgi:hypothetical protein
MPFVNTISFSRRYSSDKAPSYESSDGCSYVEVNHTYSAENTTVMARCFAEFMVGAGYSPADVLEGMATVVSEDGKNWGYNGGKISN